jgi:hypothetical protein
MDTEFLCLDCRYLGNPGLSWKDKFMIAEGNSL